MVASEEHGGPGSREGQAAMTRGTFRFDERSGQVVEIPRPKPAAGQEPRPQPEPQKLYTGFYL